MCVLFVWVCIQVVYISCSFLSGLYVSLCIRLHIEGNIIYSCTNKGLCVCVHASKLMYSSLHICAGCSCVCYTKMSGLSFCMQYVSICMLILPSSLLFEACIRQGMRHSFPMEKASILGFHFPKLIQDDVPPLWKKKTKTVLHLTELFTRTGSNVMLPMHWRTSLDPVDEICFTCYRPL